MSTAAAPNKRQPIPFGKYLLLDRINIGGMAEVWRAKTFGANGFERIVAIKRILPNIAEDEEFISMFIDEAKITVQLNHANIGQIYELSHISNSYFIAMEYLSGRDMRAVFDRCRKKGEPAPIPLVCFVVAECCEGLDYAHSRRDRSGVEMNIVHRDVSPQNLLISYDGEVKVIDFGIAKAAGKATKTQAGILKGKFGYMSPEQIRGLPLDRRSDVFAIGVCLWELLTGERLFVGDSDFSVLEKVRKAEFTPPSTFNKKIPESLEKIVAKALAKDVDDRYQSSNELANDLKRFLLTQDSIFSRKDLAAYMRATFAEDYEREKGRIQEYIDIKAPEGMLVAAEMGFGFGAVPSGGVASSPSAITAVPPVAGPGAIQAAIERGQLGQATRTSANAPQGRTGTSVPGLPSVSAAPLEVVRRATGSMPMPVLRPSGSVAKPSSPPPRLAPPEPAPTRITGPLAAPNKPSGPVAAPGRVPRLTAAAPLLPNAGDENQSTMLVDPDSMGERPEPTRLGGLGVEQEARAARGSDWGAQPQQPFDDGQAQGEPYGDEGADDGEAQHEEPQAYDEGVPQEEPSLELPSPAPAVRGRAPQPRPAPRLAYEEEEETGETRPITSATRVPGRSRALAMVAGAAALLLVGLLALLYLRPPPNGLLLLELPEELNGKASVSINGKELTEPREENGKSLIGPVRSWPHVESVPSGPATVMVKAEGYEPLIETVTVKEGNEYTRLAKKLVKRGAPAP